MILVKLSTPEPGLIYDHKSINGNRLKPPYVDPGQSLSSYFLNTRLQVSEISGGS